MIFSLRRVRFKNACLGIAGSIFLTASSQAAYVFTPISDPNDLTFTQLLGINNNGTIVGYFGSGAAGHPNQGFILTAPNTFTPLNPNNSVQTQVFGITSSGATTAGFYIDANGVNHGFYDVGNGPTATVVDNPLAASTPAVNQLLGLNNNAFAAGFYVDAGGLDQAYTVQIGSPSTFTPVPLLPAGDASQATGINNANWVSGFYMPTATTATGYLYNPVTNSLLSLNFPGSTFTQALGLNNLGQVVGTYTDAANVMHGFVYSNGVYNSFDAPGAVGMTTANGINDLGQIVGFFTDANGNTIGFEANAVPEPGSFGMAGLGALAIGLISVSSRAYRGKAKPADPRG